MKPTQPNTIRRFRLWDAVRQQPIRWRYYSNPVRAANGALKEAHWSRPGAVIEVYDITRGNTLAIYHKRPSGLDTSHSRTFKEWLRLHGGVR